MPHVEVLSRLEARLRAPEAAQNTHDCLLVSCTIREVEGRESKGSNSSSAIQMRLESTCAVRDAHKKIIIVGEGHEITMVFAREVSMKIVFKFQMVLNDSFNLRM